MRRRKTADPNRGVPLSELKVMPALRWVKFIKSKGKAYAYFVVGRNEAGEPITVPLPRIGSDEFLGAYQSLLEQRPQKVSRYDVGEALERAEVMVEEALQTARMPMLVYFIQSGEDAIKIGVAKNPASRLARLQVGNPALLQLVAVTEGGFEMEREYHDRFAALHIRGEWFNLSDEIKAEVAAIQNKRCMGNHAGKPRSKQLDLLASILSVGKP